MGKFFGMGALGIKMGRAAALPYQNQITVGRRCRAAQTSRRRMTKDNSALRANPGLNDGVPLGFAAKARSSDSDFISSLLLWQRDDLMFQPPLKQNCYAEAGDVAVSASG
jgi:hypothetical protein